MDVLTPTPHPGLTLKEIFTSSSPPKVVPWENDAHLDDGNIAALIGGIVGAVLVVLICVIALLLWCLSRHKGSYVTNEMDDDDDDIVNDDEDDDDAESVGSDMGLQTQEPLKIEEEE